MKKGLLKSLLCFALAGTLLFGDAGLALAAVSNDVQPATQTQQVKATTASVSYVDAWTNFAGIVVDFEGYGAKFEVYVNDVLCQTYYNDSAYDSQEQAPSYWGTKDTYVSPQAGATYTIKVVPYTAAGVAGTAATTTYKKEFPSYVYSNYAYSGQTPVYDANNLTTGYGKVYVYGNFSDSSDDYITYEIWRAEKKNGNYKKVTTASGYGYYNWSDNTVTLGKTYYYKMRPVTKPDGGFVKKEEYGAFTTPIEVELAKPTVACYAAYTEEGVIVEANSYTLATGFEVYRASKKSGKYSKIATISDTYYIDKTAKSGKTYYYKMKPFFYNTETKKTTYGALSDAAGVKVNLSSGSYLEITQTAKNKVKLQWDKVKGAVAYEIYKKSDIAGEGYKYVTTTKKTSYTAKVATDAYTYFRVRAVKKKNSIKSEYIVMSNGINTGFTAPRNLEISKKSASIKSNTMSIKTTLKWDKVYGAKSYRVEVYDNSKDEWVAFKKLSKTTITITNTKKLGEGWKYGDGVRVYAIKGDEEDYTSNYCLTDLAAVSGVKVTKNNATSAKITWKTVKGADTYSVYRRTPTGNNIYLGETTKTNFIDKKLTPGVNYIYEVTAHNSKYYAYSGSAYDEDKEVYTNQAIYNHKSAAPKISSVSKKAKVTWKKVDGATQYVVYRATNQKGKYEKVGTSKTTSFTDKKAKNGKTYYYKVVAVTKNDAGVNVESAMSAAKKSAKIKK